MCVCVCMCVGCVVRYRRGFASFIPRGLLLPIMSSPLPLSCRTDERLVETGELDRKRCTTVRGGEGEERVR